MTWSMVTWAKLILAVTFVAAAFFVAPIADAATCQPEPPAAHALVDHDPAEGDHTGGKDHGICSHGHCHHTAAASTTVGEDLPLQAFDRPLHALPLSDLFGSIAPDGLKRPPRA